MKTCHLEFLLHYDKTQGEQVELLVPHIQDVLSFFIGIFIPITRLVRQFKKIELRHAYTQINLALNT